MSYINYNSGFSFSYENDREVQETLRKENSNLDQVVSNNIKVYKQVNEIIDNGLKFDSNPSISSSPVNDPTISYYKILWCKKSRKNLFSSLHAYGTVYHLDAW